MKTLHLTDKQHEILVNILDALQTGADARGAAQRTQERHHDVEPVAEGSEEEAAIWEALHETFNLVRAAPERVYNQSDARALWDRYYAIVGTDETLGPAQISKLLELIREAPLKRKRDSSGLTQGYWIWTAPDGKRLGLGISYHASGEHCMCDEELSDIEART